MKTEAHSHQWMWRTGQIDVSFKRYPFGLLLGLSLAIHLLVLATWPALQPKQLRLALPSADFSIHLQHTEVKTESIPARPVSNLATAPVAKPAPVPALPRTAPSKAHKTRQTITKPGPSVKTVPVELAATAKNTPNKESRSPSATSLRPLKETVSSISQNHVISRLQQELKQYFYYPRLAQRKNIQGTVILGFAINPQGTLTNIRIVKSSGFAVLDMAAEDALQKLQQLNWDQDRDRRYLQRDNSSIKLPVIYKLTES